MRNFSTITVSLALAGACTSTHRAEDQPLISDDAIHDHGNCNGSGDGSGSGSGSSSACPLGAAEFTTLVQDGVSQRQDANLAIDRSGDVFVAGSITSTFITNVFLGVAEISPTGQLGMTLPYGSLVATDAGGNLFVAGTFSSRIDFGNNVVLDPTDTIDVFVAKLDAKGSLVFAKAVDPCGDGVSALAVSRDGRIAVSGSAMGTAVLDAHGDLLYTLDVFGKVAFDSAGDLVVAGTVANATDMFVAMFDASGAQLFDETFTASSSHVGGIAIDMNGHIAIVGSTDGTIDLFGTQVVAHNETEVGRTTGAFLLVIDHSGNLVMANDLNMTEANGVAFDAKGNIFIAGASTSGMAFNRLITVAEVDTGGRLTVLSSISGLNGRALSLAVDACGALYVALTEQRAGGISPIQFQVVKLAL